MTAPLVVFFDIDGTLLTTGRAGIKAWEDAALAVAGVPLDLTDMRTSGLTDRMIARMILEMAGSTVDDDTERRLCEVYAGELPRRLLEKRGGVLPGVFELIEALGSRPDTLVALITGNLRAGAEAKLESYGLRHYFDVGGFADDGFDRSDIGRAAIGRVEERVGPLDLERVYLIGDSPYDVSCAVTLGLRGVAVATGEHAVAELAQGGPWWALDCMPTPEQFFARVDAAAGADLT